MPMVLYAKEKRVSKDCRH